MVVRFRQCEDAHGCKHGYGPCGVRPVYWLRRKRPTGSLLPAPISWSGVPVPPISNNPKLGWPSTCASSQGCLALRTSWSSGAFARPALASRHRSRFRTRKRHLCASERHGLNLIASRWALRNIGAMLGEDSIKQAELRDPHKVVYLFHPHAQ
jgi:hypothetical protein